MRTNVLLAVASIVLVTTGSGIAWAQSRDTSGDPPPPPPKSDAQHDETFVRELAKERAAGGSGKGLILIDASLQGMPCEAVSFSVAPVVDGKLGQSWTMTGSGRNRDGSLYYQVLKAVPAGDYVVSSLRCKFRNNTNNLVGPHAKFQVRPGEFENVGTLVYHYQKDEGFFATTGVSRRSVGPTKPEVLAELKSRFPRTMKIAVNRSMTIIGAAEGKTKQRLW